MNPRVALFGVGGWGKNLARVLDAQGALAAAVDPGPSARAHLAAHHPRAVLRASVAETLADPQIDAVVIATPPATHAALAIEALRAGKHVFVEKPLALSRADGVEVAAVAKETGRVLMVGHLLWYHPAVLALKKLVAAGELGRIQHIYSTRLNLGRVRTEENILWSFAPHDISVVLGLLEEEPNEVSAHATAALRKDIPDVTVSFMRFPSGASAHFFVSWLHPYKEQKLVLVGDKQMAVFDDLAADKLVLYPHKVEWNERAPVVERAQGVAVPVAADEPLAAEIAHFLAAVQTGAPVRTDAAEGLRVLSVLERCQAAIGRATVSPMDYRAHESAFIDDGCTIGAGTTIWHVSHVMTGSVIGKNCRIGQNVVIGPRVTIGDDVKIQNNVSVYEGVTLEDHVFCGPSMVFTNVHNPRAEIPRMDELRLTRVCRGATLGANCTVVCGHTIGAYAFVGAGAVVTHDVAEYALVTGVPAERVGWVCRCGVKLAGDGPRYVCAACQRVFLQSGETLRADDVKVPP